MKLPLGQRKLKDLKGQNIVVYDLEIKKPIDGKEITWGSHHKMGISVGCAYDYRESRYRVFLDDNMPDLVKRLNEPGTLVVAFNQIGFDNKILRLDEMLQTKLEAYERDPFPEDSKILNYDMLVESRLGAGVNMFAKGFKLAQHLAHMGLPSKTDDGANAPLLYQNRKLGELVDYCLADVRAEKSLFDYVYIKCQMATEGHPEFYTVRDPADLIVWQ